MYRMQIISKTQVVGSDIGGIILFLNEKEFFATEWDDKPIVANSMEAMRAKSSKEVKEVKEEVKEAKEVKKELKKMQKK